jgi:hypothetical protein|tara:strand:+ start:6267 stop:6374 length:108 start_codon:yes stop_codon:yes gene_type:complete
MGTAILWFLLAIGVAMIGKAIGKYFWPEDWPDENF